jgi:hypothetical protein
VSNSQQKVTMGSCPNPRLSRETEQQYYSNRSVPNCLYTSINDTSVFYVRKWKFRSLKSKFDVTVFQIQILVLNTTSYSSIQIQHHKNNAIILVLREILGSHSGNNEE